MRFYRLTNSWLSLCGYESRHCFKLNVGILVCYWMHANGESKFCIIILEECFDGLNYFELIKMELMNLENNLDSNLVASSVSNGYNYES